jgi:hypothetical protein
MRRCDQTDQKLKIAKYILLLIARAFRNPSSALNMSKSSPLVHDPGFEARWHWPRGISRELM